jgi:hypothetical protein
MAIRKSMQEEMVVSGPREEWLPRCAAALEAARFSNVITNTTLHQVEGEYRKIRTSGSLLITLTPAADDTKITAVSTANVDNIYALFTSPNKTILSKFKEALG